MPPPSDSEETWLLSEVYLLTDGRDGRIAIPRLQLDLGPTGIRLAKENADIAWSCRWDALSELSSAERSVLPNGNEGVVLVMVERAGRRHRFVIPTDEPTALESRLRRLAVNHRLYTRNPARAVSGGLTLAVVAGSVGTLTVLLLSAAHVIHF
jgi:hypothetical protein